MNSTRTSWPARGTRRLVCSSQCRPCLAWRTRWWPAGPDTVGAPTSTCTRAGSGYTRATGPTTPSRSMPSPRTARSRSCSKSPPRSAAHHPNACSAVARRIHSRESRQTMPSHSRHPLTGYSLLRCRARLQGTSMWTRRRRWQAQLQGGGANAKGLRPDIRWPALDRPASLSACEPGFRNPRSYRPLGFKMTVQNCGVGLHCSFKNPAQEFATSFMKLDNLMFGTK